MGIQTAPGPLERSSIRSSGSSSPIWRRSSGPSAGPGLEAAQALHVDRQDQAFIAAPAGAHGKRARARSAWRRRLPRGPASAARRTDPTHRRKSRFQRAWPGSSGKAGNRTRATSGRSCSQRATISAFSSCLLQAHGHGAQAPLGEVEDRPAPPNCRSTGRASLPPTNCSFVRHTATPHHGVRMTDHVFGGGRGSRCRRHGRSAGTATASPRYCRSC